MFDYRNVFVAFGETWQYIDDPVKYVIETNGLLDREPEGTARSMAGTEEINAGRSKEVLSEEVNAAVQIGEQKWNASYPEDGTSGMREEKL